jgi:hypothetical protein
MTLNIHRVSKVRAGAARRVNGIAVTLYITTSDVDPFEIILSGLSTEDAEHLSRALNGKPPLDEAAIRADERQSIANLLAKVCAP